MNGFRSHAFLTCSAAATLAPIFILAAGHWDILELGCFRPPMPNLYILDWEWDAVEVWIYDVFFFFNFYTWELQMYGNFCRFRISEKNQISLLKTVFGGIPLLATNFGGIDCWMFALVKAENMSANFGGIACNFGGITRTQLWLQICTTHENPISAELKIVGNFFLLSAEILEFGDSCAEM